MVYRKLLELEVSGNFSRSIEISKFITNFFGSKNFPIENKRGTRLIKIKNLHR